MRHLIASHIALCQQSIVHGNGRVEADATRWRIIQVLLAHVVSRHSMSDEAAKAWQYHAIILAQEEVDMSSQSIHSATKVV